MTRVQLCLCDVVRKLNAKILMLRMYKVYHLSLAWRVTSARTKHNIQLRLMGMSSLALKVFNHSTG